MKGIIKYNSKDFKASEDVDRNNIYKLTNSAMLPKSMALLVAGLPKSFLPSVDAVKLVRYVMILP